MTRKLLALLLSVLLVLAVVPFTAVSAQEPVMMDGVRTVFLSGFGRVNYGGKTQTAFKTFDEALAALGNEGGRIVFTGNIDLSTYVDAAGRGPITFEGVGKVSASKLNFGEAAAVNLSGDTYFNNVQLVTAPDVPIYTNGHTFMTTGDIECNYSEQFVQDGNNIITYLSPFVFAAGNVSSGAALDTVTVSSGHTKAVVGGSHGANNVNANTRFNIGGGNVETIYAGNYASEGTFTGNSDITVSQGTVEKAVIGSESGTTNANLSVTLTGGLIKDLYLGSENATAVSGNITFALYGGVVNRVISKKDTVTGKVIVIDSTESGKVPEGSYDYLIKANGVKVAPAYNGTTLTGFEVTDANGFTPSKVFANGAEVALTNGVYALPEGVVTVTCESSAAIAPNKNAAYVAGYEDGTFLPQNNITRAEAITMLSRIICSDISRLSAIAKCSYSDVAPTDWYAGVVGFFEKLGYLKKLEQNGAISPKQYITRGEFAELSRFVISEVYGGKQFGVSTFPDVSFEHKYFDSIGQLAYLGVIGGYEDGSFKPENNITRAEAVTIVNRFLGRTPTGSVGATVFFDIENHWAKGQILAACNPAVSAGNTVWTLTEDITRGNFELLTGEVTVGDQIKNLYNKYDSITSKDVVEGIDKISKWQIDNIVAAKSEYPTTGKIYYVSNNGDNDNDGLSPETPWRTLSRLAGIKGRATIKAGDAVLFERGGEWRGSLDCIGGVTYSAYGEGAKPIINSSKRNYADVKYWTETEYENVYKCALPPTNVGIMAFDFTGELGNYNETMGVMKIIGVGGIEGAKDLRNDYEFLCDLSTGDLFLYCTGGNPGERFTSIEIGAQGTSLNITEDNVTIDNLNVRFTGSHGVGIGGRKNVTVRNCIFDYLGGSILRGFHGVNTTRYGNALQVYGSCDGWYLYDNWIYQIYDTGVTHQYNSPYDQQSAFMDNVKYIGNVIEYCHWSIEYYNPDYGNTEHTFYNTYIADNICRLNGYGWGSRHRMTSSTLFQSAGITKNTKNFVTENNIFDRSAGQLININSTGDRELELKNNIYVQNVGGKMGTLFGAYWMADADSAARLKYGTDDTTSKILFNNDTTVNDYLVYKK